MGTSKTRLLTALLCLALTGACDDEDDSNKAPGGDGDQQGDGDGDGDQQGDGDGDQQGDGDGDQQGDGDGDGDQQGDGDGKPGSVPDGTKISAVTPAQAALLCKEFEQRSAGLIEQLDKVTCTVVGLSYAAQGGGQTCEEVRDECLSEPSEAEPCDLSEGGETCDATVGEYRACVDASLKSLQDFYSDLSCESDLESLPEEEPPMPAQCTALFAKCPELED
jgi:hypothetical protein